MLLRQLSNMASKQINLTLTSMWLNKTFFPSEFACKQTPNKLWTKIQFSDLLQKVGFKDN